MSSSPQCPFTWSYASLLSRIPAFLWHPNRSSFSIIALSLAWSPSPLFLSWLNTKNVSTTAERSPSSSPGHRFFGCRIYPRTRSHEQHKGFLLSSSETKMVWLQILNSSTNNLAILVDKEGNIAAVGTEDEVDLIILPWINLFFEVLRFLSFPRTQIPLICRLGIISASHRLP